MRTTRVRVALYSFDVFSTGLAYVDEVQCECCDRAAADHYARELLTVAIGQHAIAGCPNIAFTAIVYEDGVGIVLTLVVEPGGMVQVGWLAP